MVNLNLNLSALVMVNLNLNLSTPIGQLTVLLNFNLWNKLKFY
jgi:hypothetical protein